MLKEENKSVNFTGICTRSTEKNEGTLVWMFIRVQNLHIPTKTPYLNVIKKRAGFVWPWKLIGYCRSLIGRFHMTSLCYIASVRNLDAGQEVMLLQVAMIVILKGEKYKKAHRTML